MNAIRRRTSPKSPLVVVSVSLALGLAALLLAEPPQVAKPSSYAPAKDLLAQVDELVGRLEIDLETEADYGEDAQQRVAKDAGTLAAVALVLGMHDEEHRLKGSAASIVAAARKVGAGAKDYAKSKAAMAELETALAATGGGEKLAWKPVADVAQLMKQVPIVNNNLRRGVEGRRFAREIDKNASYAATLAAIAQAAAFDTTYCADEAEEAKWRELSTALRNASAAVGKQVRAGDQEAAVKALEAVETSCTNCHEAFNVK